MRQSNRLTASAVKALIANPPAKAAYTPDGHGLYLQRSPAGAASWIYRYKLFGREHFVGLGSARIVTLAAAREKADEHRRLRAGGIDPLSQKVGARRLAKHEAEHRITFAAAAAKYIDLRRPEWSASNLDAWEGSIRLHAKAIARMDVRHIGTQDVLRVIEPLWEAKHATAVALRQRIEAILDWSKSHGYREGDNPAAFEGHLQNLLTKMKERTTHRASIDWRAMPAFAAKLRAAEGGVARLVEFLMLTGARSEEGAGATWKEIDLKARVWRVPAERMKAKVEHWVPLSAEAVKLLKGLPGERGPDDRLFDSAMGKQIANSVQRDLLRKLGYPKEDASIHGLRSSLRTWAVESAKANERVAESLIAHDTRKEVQQAYERTRFFEDRTPIMAAWSRYLDGGNVVPLDRTRPRKAA
ncbi:MAG TPA: tyrosine-type recombinase/integrase [Paraburkholderia sp.]|uniref:tyrosine-type recombinase/integrase n=1 Tax=Paraburkholderia sp. TaxID=1926495 RepID=UPI002B483DAD|nr:tyrosine-type recombinase/integrase [Paraburkholderia sp.]HKR43813.1 tyrosine-type recombinase/integrase [Paraburkholderia sp.]